MASTVRKPNLLTKSQGDGKVVHFLIFRKKSEFLENFGEIPLNRSVPIGLEMLLGISSNNFRFFGY